MYVCIRLNGGRQTDALAPAAADKPMSSNAVHIHADYGSARRCTYSPVSQPSSHQVGAGRASAVHCPSGKTSMNGSISPPPLDSDRWTKADFPACPLPLILARARDYRVANAMPGWHPLLDLAPVPGPASCRALPHGGRRHLAVTYKFPVRST